MALILHIDTALEKASVGVSKDGVLLRELTSSVPNAHAAFVQPAIQEVMESQQIGLERLDAVGVVSGPGSYTGLRVGMASAKGICYALKKPLIGICTLEVMTCAAIDLFPGFDYYAPMIDARRMEVFTALYNARLEPRIDPSPVILSPDLFLDVNSKQKILCFGSGSSKWEKGQILNKNISLVDLDYNGIHLAQLFFTFYGKNNFIDLAYSEPLYLKDFYFRNTEKG
ncbi:MAG: tRNA (adenosine(37)-N6)-threonylcarbamoyltransferase complex dimerization subunit type 1 TsaB [Chitinophagaceae bacterium]|nr:tRNA (adenosine(37)-N6)-threonylcarbamoyltransferase complex dimerization subunit type 1 TsaB [Chitinophagaceae bacterium]